MTRSEDLGRLLGAGHIQFITTPYSFFTVQPRRCQSFSAIGSSPVIKSENLQRKISHFDGKIENDLITQPPGTIMRKKSRKKHRAPEPPAGIRPFSVIFENKPDRSVGVRPFSMILNKNENRIFDF